ncbi:hypothetical protein [Paenibacillus sp. GYB003]|uniref:hypothetical protein n=1 Tax=Paenibacillus sp. GYB003 TaxID=2994392 RepID=UPI002F96AB86
MIIGLLSIFGAYGLAIALVHFGWYRLRRSRLGPIHYVLITKNNAMHIEWYLRSLLFVSRLKAREVRIVILDESSEDETLAIVERLAADRPETIEAVAWNEAGQLDEIMTRYDDEEVVLVRLANEKELIQIPLFQ